MPGRLIGGRRECESDPQAFQTVLERTADAGSIADTLELRPGRPLAGLNELGDPSRAGVGKDIQQIAQPGRRNDGDIATVTLVGH